tara:strand:- start:2860 stop:3210 length:351 start_codon:yes stop_codon:yes gene_type:complete
MEALCDDLNTPKALAELNNLASKISQGNISEKVKIKSGILNAGKLIGILENDPQKWLGYGNSKNLDDQKIEILIKRRNEARREKNFELADKIRRDLKDKGIEIEDNDKETVWRNIK